LKRWLGVYALICSVTILLAGCVAVSGRFTNTVRGLLDLHLSAAATPAPSVARAFGLAAHNLPVVAWPLLLGAAGARRSRARRRIADALLVASVTANVVPVAAALGAYGRGLVAFAPQLPLEWAALALGVTAWRGIKPGRDDAHRWLTRLSLIVVLVAVAASLETFAVPHVGAAGFGRGASKPPGSTVKHTVSSTGGSRHGCHSHDAVHGALVTVLDGQAGRVEGRGAPRRMAGDGGKGCPRLPGVPGP
jgi:hypothetical protein